MPIKAVQFGNIYGVKAMQQAKQRPAEQAYTVDAVKEIELHPEAKNEFRANKLDFLA